MAESKSRLFYFTRKSDYKKHSLKLLLDEFSLSKLKRMEAKVKAVILGNKDSKNKKTIKYLNTC